MPGLFALSHSLAMTPLALLKSSPVDGKMADSAEYILVTEDLQARVFVRRALIAVGVERRKIRVRSLPSGGAGDHHVRKEYPTEVLVFRRRLAAKALIVHIDADPKHSVLDRHRELERALHSSKQSLRTADEAIVELIPKRNIETWLDCLDGSTVDEETVYPKRPGRERECESAAKKFATDAKNGTRPLPTTPSLDDGLKEMKRLRL